jgi:hypothetical protein
MTGSGTQSYRPDIDGLRAIAVGVVVPEGLDPNVFEVDRQLSSSLANTAGLTYVSLVARLCNHEGCLATVPGGAATDLMAFDFGHLTPLGSSYIGREVLKAYLERAAR